MEKPICTICGKRIDDWPIEGELGWWAFGPESSGKSYHQLCAQNKLLVDAMNDYERAGKK